MSVETLLFKRSRTFKTLTSQGSSKYRSTSRYFELELTLSGLTEVLPQISSELALRAVQILSDVHTRLEDRFLWRFLIEVPKSVSMKHVSEILSRLDSVLEVRWTEVDKPDSLDSFFPVHLYGDRAIIFTSSMFHAIIKEVSDLITKAGEERLFYRKGAIVAYTLYERLIKFMGSVDDKLAFTEDLLKSLG